MLGFGVSIRVRVSVKLSFFSTVAPQLVKVPHQFLLIEEGTTAAITCEAFSYPPSVITWARAFAALPKKRTSVTNGKMIIAKFSMADSGTYICTASNKLGSVTAVTTLGFQRKLGNYKKKASSLSCRFTFFWYFRILRLLFLVYSSGALKKQKKQKKQKKKIERLSEQLTSAHRNVPGCSVNVVSTRTMRHGTQCVEQLVVD